MKKETQLNTPVNEEDHKKVGYVWYIIEGTKEDIEEINNIIAGSPFDPNYCYLYREVYQRFHEMAVKRFPHRHSPFPYDTYIPNHTSMENYADKENSISFIFSSMTDKFWDFELCRLQKLLNELYPRLNAQCLFFTYEEGGIMATTDDVNGKIFPYRYLSCSNDAPMNFCRDLEELVKETERITRRENLHTFEDCQKAAVEYGETAEDGNSYMDVYKINRI